MDYRGKAQHGRNKCGEVCGCFAGPDYLARDFLCEFRSAEYGLGSTGVTSLAARNG